MRRFIRLVVLMFAMLLAVPALGEARLVHPPYAPPKVMFDFYLDDPQKIGTALFWVRSLMNPLMEEPYAMPPDDMDIVVIIHGTEIVTVATKNAAKYQEAVDRMRYYADLGVKFRVCGIAAQDYGYAAKDFQDFIEIAPSAITELAHWQQQGFAIITPQVMDKKFALEEIR
jgi:intracellular sulfur oxidation DsrE/DsrF family protein